MNWSGNRRFFAVGIGKNFRTRQSLPPIPVWDGNPCRPLPQVREA